MVVAVKTYFIACQTVGYINDTIGKGYIHLQSSNPVAVVKTHSNSLFLAWLYVKALYRHLVVGQCASKRTNRHKACHNQP